MKKIAAFILTAIILFSCAYADNVIKQAYELTVRNITLPGKYTGEMESNVPNGFGIYETVTPDGTPCHYIGQWSNGLMHGNGATYWNDGSIEIGEYQNGLFIAGKYNYNSLKLLTAEAEGDETLNPHWLFPNKNLGEEETDKHTVQYIGNRNSRVFHRLNCDSIRTMKEKNKQEFYSREEAIEKHYEPCSRCNP